MVGQSVQQYKILEKLGEGGMGVVYKAHDTSLDRMVALKFLRSDHSNNKKITDRFLREAKVISRLDHPNIAVIHEISETREGQPFICMAYYDGKTLAEVLHEAPLPIGQILAISKQILDGLERSHTAGVVHRDIKPGNIVFSTDGHLKLVDFGIAKQTEEPGMTTEGMNPGTLMYMSPEQIRGEDVDTRSDLFSFGIILYEMITGRHPFAGEYDQVIGYKLLNENPAPPGRIRPDVPPELGNIVMRCLEKEPELRYSSATEIHQELENQLKDHSPATLKELNRQSSPWTDILGRLSIHRHVSLSVIGLLLILILILIRAANLSYQSAETLPDMHQLVVLPFTDLNESGETRLLCDGLMETITSSLTLLQPDKETFWVVAANEVRDRNINSAADARREFNATIAITSSLQRIGDNYRLYLNLVDTETLRQIRTDFVEVSASTLSQFHDLAVMKIASMLGIEPDQEFTAKINAGGTVDPVAYEYYLKGKGALQQYQRLENILSAIEFFHLSTMADERFALAYAGLGEAHMRRFLETGETEWVHPAIENARFALELDTMNPEIHRTHAIINRETGNIEQARETLENLIQLDSSNAFAINDLAYVYEILGENSLAEEYYIRAIELKPTYWAFHNHLGAFYYAQGRLEDAVNKFHDVTEINPENVRGFTNLGGIYFELGRHSEAAEMLEHSLNLEPTYDAYSNLGTIYLYEKKFNESVNAFEEALNLQDTDSRVWANLGSAYRLAGMNEEKSVESYRQAIELAEKQLSINPRDAELLSHTASYYALLAEKDRVREYAQRALEEAPFHAGVLGRSAIAYERIGEREEALKLIEKALATGFPVNRINREPDMNDLQEDERYISLLNTVNIQ
jgi:eukaryotic-like serine/threonine-protein kinase